MSIRNEKLNRELDKLVALIIDNNETGEIKKERELIEPILEALFVKCGHNAARTKKALDNMIRSRLPSPMILNSFPGFHSKLTNNINGIYEQFIYYQEIFQFLKILFPHAKIQRNQRLVNKKIDFLIPDKRLGIILSPDLINKNKSLMKPKAVRNLLIYELNRNILTHRELKRILYW